MKKLCLLSFLLCSISVFSQIEVPAEESEEESIEVVFDELPEEEEIYMVVENMPVYRGCEELNGSSDEKALCNRNQIDYYLAAKARFPENTEREDLDGAWYFSYVVNEKAEIEQVKVLRDPTSGNPEMEKEAIRLIESLDFVEPGIWRERSVKVQYKGSVKFRTDEEFSDLVKKGYGPKFLEGWRAVVPPGCEEFVGEEEQLKSCSLEHIERFVYENTVVPGVVKEMDLRLASVVIFSVGKDGSVEEAEIKKSAQEFVNSSSEEEVEAAEAADKAALDVVKKLKFTIPEQNNEELKNLTCQVPVVFISK